MKLFKKFMIMKMILVQLIIIIKIYQAGLKKLSNTLWSQKKSKKIKEMKKTTIYIKIMMPTHK